MRSMKNSRSRKFVYSALVLAGLGGLFLFSVSAPAQDAKTDADKVWHERCSDREGGKKYCEIFARKVATETKQRVVEMAVGYPEEAGGKARGVVVLPLGIMLNHKDKVQMAIDDKSPFRFDIRYCTGDGCFAFLNLSDETVNMLKKGTNVTFAMHDRNGEKKVTVDLPLTGFSKALESVAP